MGSFDFLSSIIRLAWPALAVATFVVCLQVQKRNKGAAGVSLLVAGSVLVMLVSLASNLLQFLLLNEGLDYSSISGYFSITSMVSLVGQVLFLVGLYQFGTAQRAGREELYDDLLDDLPG